MVNGMRYLQTSCERAPALLISHKKPSSCPRLETIVEEGSELSLEELLSNNITFALLGTIFLTSILLFLRSHFAAEQRVVKSFCCMQKMAKDVRYKQNWSEVAPALLISHQRPSNFPRLETIAEEDCSSVRVPKRVFILLPVLLSLSFYVLLYRYIA